MFLLLWFIALSLSPLSFLGCLTPSCVCFLNYFREGEETLSECFLFLRHAGVGQIDTGVGILESSVFLPNDLADIFNGESVWW